MSPNRHSSIYLTIIIFISFQISNILCDKLTASYEDDDEHAPDPVCAEHPDSGVGAKLMHGWYFNVEISQCREMVYRGHGGNGNRFPTLHDCEHRCMRKYVEGALDSGPKIKAPINHRMKEVKKHFSYRLTPVERHSEHRKSRGEFDEEYGIFSDTEQLYPEQKPIKKYDKFFTKYVSPRIDDHTNAVHSPQLHENADFGAILKRITDEESEQTDTTTESTDTTTESTDTTTKAINANNGDRSGDKNLQTSLQNMEWELKAVNYNNPTQKVQNYKMINKVKVYPPPASNVAEDMREYEVLESKNINASHSYVNVKQTSLLPGTRSNTPVGKIRQIIGFIPIVNRAFGTKCWDDVGCFSAMTFKDIEMGDIALLPMSAKQLNYALSAANTQVVGALIAFFINRICADTYGRDVITNDQFYLVGHSLGAHVVGFAGKRLINPQVHRVTGLDPAGPGFEANSTNIRLAYTDGKEVDIIHSDMASMVLDGLGLNETIGDIDFYPNGGYMQPGCPQTNLVVSVLKASATLSCSHCRAYDLAIAYDRPNDLCLPIGYECDSYAMFVEGRCVNCDNINGITRCQLMGLYPLERRDTNITAQYFKGKGHKLYLNTGDGKPLCLTHYQIALHVTADSEAGARGQIALNIGAWYEGGQRNMTNIRTMSNIVPGKVHTMLLTTTDLITNITSASFSWIRNDYSVWLCPVENVAITPDGSPLYFTVCENKDQLPKSAKQILPSALVPFTSSNDIYSTRHHNEYVVYGPKYFRAELDDNVVQPRSATSAKGLDPFRRLGSLDILSELREDVSRFISKIPIIGRSLGTECWATIGCFSALTFKDIVNGHIAVLPLGPQEINITFQMYSHGSQHQSIELKIDFKKSQLKNFDPNHRTAVIIHGFMGHIQEWMIDIKDTLYSMATGNDSFNVVLVDWHKGAEANYPLAASNTRVVGALIAEFIQRLCERFDGLTNERFWLIGHSLGAHTAGYAGKRLTKPQVGRLTAMDPAGPGFRTNESEWRLSLKDASVVDVIHTDMSDSFDDGLGVNEAIGDFDFFPNGGKYQANDN
ncbi:unnamed protein product [Medioppia subpectinata]|uniref:BPTI/Kunitz inhibitor domain-containing protein n=1 Tax=Medioppia subpectinata TaxID=1979941 RepID=A0A7R9KBN2_9ACAR|nr:unnamed protein product [Medioppia subpectinata]CAG2100125.1 unnamed protein product [Medioppia subpectinata]